MAKTIKIIENGTSVEGFFLTYVQESYWADEGQLRLSASNVGEIKISKTQAKRMIKFLYEYIDSTQE